jgi:predicted nucleic acid-binding protein
MRPRQRISRFHWSIKRARKLRCKPRLVETFFAEPVGLLACAPEDAKVAGRVRADLEVVGKPIGTYDLLIAGQPLRHQMTLITANGRGFGRVKGLEWKDWAKAGTSR